MEHYSSIKLRAYLKYEDGLAVLDLKGNKLFRVPDAATELSEIDKLVLDENNLIDLPASISKLKNLIVLKLDENKLTTLPAEIGDLRELRVLWVRLNQLVGLPTSIQRLTKLKELRLNENKLTELPAEIGDLRELRELSMSYNQLVGLPTSIQRLTKLERLNLDANKLTELHVEIGDLRELKELSVSQNPLTVDAIRCALKLREKGVLVGVPGVAGEHSGYFSYIWKFKKTRDKIPVFACRREVSFVFSQCHQQLLPWRSDRQQGSDRMCPTYIQGDQRGLKQDQGDDKHSQNDILNLLLLSCTIQTQIPSY